MFSKDQVILHVRPVFSSKIMCHRGYVFLEHFLFQNYHVSAKSKAVSSLISCHNAIQEHNLFFLKKKKVKNLNISSNNC